MSNQPRCPYCGKYQPNEPDGYFGKLNPANDISPVEVFCNESHYDRYQKKGPAFVSDAERFARKYFFGT